VPKSTVEIDNGSHHAVGRRHSLTFHSWSRERLCAPRIAIDLLTEKENDMKAKYKVALAMVGSFALGAMIVCFSTTAFAQGTAAEAKAMLEKTVAAIKADKAKTLDLINKGEGGFLDRDLYPFCNNVGDGKAVALGNPNAKQLLGTDARTLKDSTGKAFGEELFAAGQKPEGQITEVSYMFVRPGPDKTPVPKVSFVTRVGDLYCGVGYYK
jgi:hypothetical protein